MSARPLVRAAAVLSLTLLSTAGCQTYPGNSSNAVSSGDRAGAAARSQAPPSFTSPDRAAPEPAPPDATAALPDALSRKTAAYAQSMEPAAGAARAGAAGTPSAVQWGQPHAEAASPRTPRVPRVAANAPASLPDAQPPSATGGVASRDAAGTGGAARARALAGSPEVAALARSASTNALGDVPAIVPESSDFEPASAHPAAAIIAPPPDSVESEVSQRVQQDPHDVAAQLDNQLVLMMKDQPAPQLASMPALSGEDQELVNTLVDGLTNFRTNVRQDENMLLVNKIRPLLDMADRLRAQAELSVPTVVLCRQVTAFGVYDPIMPPRFPAGQENTVLVYCEIENFASRHNSGDEWETSLSQQVTLFTDTGMLVWKDRAHEVPDKCRNRRHDFFMYDRIHLPANLTIGRYILKVTIIDRNASRVAEKTVPLEIGAGSSDADGGAVAAAAGHSDDGQAQTAGSSSPPAPSLPDGR